MTTLKPPTRTLTRTLPAALVVAALAVAAAPALTTAAEAKGGTRVIRTGDCTGSTNWKIKAKPDDGRIEVEAEIDSNRVGQTWRWTLTHDGGVSARGTSVTRAPSGSFTVTRRLVDSAGSDTFVLRATHGSEVCRATVRL